MFKSVLSVLLLLAVTFCVIDYTEAQWGWGGGYGGYGGYHPYGMHGPFGPYGYRRMMMRQMMYGGMYHPYGMYGK